MARKSPLRRGRTGHARLAAAVVYGAGLLAAAMPGPVSADPAAQQMAYRLPPGLRDGRCRPEMFEPSAAGGLVGAAGGGFAGASFGKGKGTLAATAIGSLIGAAVGRPVRNVIARPEETCFSQSFEHVPDRRTIVWMDPVEGVHYAVTPTRTVKGADGRHCREYEARAAVNGQAAGTYGTACRRPDGRWELMN